jgi:transposase
MIQGMRFEKEACMPGPISQDLRERIVDAIDNGASRNAAAQRFGVGISTAVRLMQHRKRHGTIAPKQMGGYRQYRLAPHEQLVRELVAATPDITIAELEKQLKKHKIKVSPSAITRYLRHLGLRFKKNSARQRAGQA